MRRFIYQFVASLALTSMLVCCRKENVNDRPSPEEPGKEEPKPEVSKPEISFKFDIEPYVIASSEDSVECAWTEGDAVGVYAYDAESDELVFGNKKLTFDGSNWVGDKLCWEKESLRFCAYYPFDENNTDPTAISVNVKEDQSSENDYRLSDFLVARNEEGVKIGSDVKLEFRHEFAMIQVEVPKSKYWNIDGKLEVSLCGVGTLAEINLLEDSDVSASAEGTGSSEGNVKMYLFELPGEERNNYIYRAVIPVQTLGGGTSLFSYVTDGKEYRLGGPVGDCALNAGNVKVFNRSLPVDYKHPDVIQMVVDQKGTYKYQGDGLWYFRMGSPKTEEGRNNTNVENQHNVHLARSYYMGKYEVTNAEYASFLNDNKIGSDGIWNGWGDAENKSKVLVRQYAKFGLIWDTELAEWKPADGYCDCPVVNVSWYGAKAFADCVGGALPTEAQWEFACRGGLEETPFGLGNGLDLTGEMANIRSAGRGTTAPVGSYPPNGFDLYDLHGNVSEWVADWFDANYYGGSGGFAWNPTGPKTGTHKVVRGGDFTMDKLSCRCASRVYCSPRVTNMLIGFRVSFDQDMKWE